MRKSRCSSREIVNPIGKYKCQHAVKRYIVFPVKAYAIGNCNLVKAINLHDGNG